MKTAPSEFQHAVDTIYGKFIQEKKVSTYLDNVIVKTYKDDLKEHLEVLEEVIDHSRNIGVCYNKLKSQLALKEACVMGYYISGKGVRTDPRLIEKVSKFVAPKDVAGVKSFLGLVGFYRRFIPYLSTVSEPLYKLLKKGDNFVWKEPQNSAFQRLKDILLRAPLLKHPTPGGPFNLYTDSSTVGIGAMLTQISGKDELPCAFYSRKLLQAESNYPTWELETLAMVCAIKRFRRYLLGTRFTVYTDCRAVAYVLNKMNLSLRINRWIAQMTEYDFEIKHIVGVKNMVADYFSRNPGMLSEDDDDEYFYHVTDNKE